MLPHPFPRTPLHENGPGGRCALPDLLLRWIWSDDGLLSVPSSLPVGAQRMRGATKEEQPQGSPRRRALASESDDAGEPPGASQHPAGAEETGAPSWARGPMPDARMATCHRTACTRLACAARGCGGGESGGKK